MSPTPSTASARQPSHSSTRSFIQYVGWDGIGLILNVLLLSFNLRLHLQNRESPASYPPVKPELINLVTEETIHALKQPSFSKATPSTPAPIQSTNTPNAITIAKPSATVATPLPKTIQDTKPAQAQATSLPAAPITSILPPAKILTREQEAHLSKTSTTTAPTIAPTKTSVESKTNSAQPSVCLAFGPLTHNRLQQLQAKWKEQSASSSTELHVLHTQPLHHYSVIFPPMGGNGLTDKQRALETNGFKQYEMWSEGKGHGVIIAGSFETEELANALNQRLHDKGFKESYLMVRTAPTLYWIKHSPAILNWLSHPPVARAQGIAWKNIPCGNTTAPVQANSPSATTH